MIIPKIPKNQAQPVFPVKAIKPATPIATATPDQPLRFTSFPFLCMLSYLQITKGPVNFKSIGSSNSTSFKVENEIHTHEDAVASARASLRSEHKHRFNGKFLCLSADGFLPSEFSQIAYSDFAKHPVKEEKQKCYNHQLN